MPKSSIKASHANQVAKSARIARGDESVVAVCNENNFVERRRKEREMNNDGEFRIEKDSKEWRELAAIIKKQQIDARCAER
jgi:hypothetical protein